MKIKKFDFPYEKIKQGFYTDKYFVRTQQILLKDNHHPHVTMQIFTKKSGIICGVEEVLSILKYSSLTPNDIVVHTLKDGDSFEPWDSVMHIEGDYSTFAHLETVYLGILARASAIATSVKRVKDIARDKAVLFFSARFDLFWTQEIDGKAALIAGADGVSTDANGAYLNVAGIGTVPHSLIAVYNGDTTLTMKKFDEYIPKDVKRIALVDFDNNCVETSLKVAEALGDKLWGVRLDTAENIRDFSVKSSGPESYGVCPELVYNVRKALDANGFSHVKIVISSGFSDEKLKKFIDMGVPFDAVGVGSFFFRNRIDFTADIVRVNGENRAKYGREYKYNNKFTTIKIGEM